METAMRTFRSDPTNFIQGTRNGTRIVSGAGVKADFNEFAPDSGALGLWHLHNAGCQGEGTGLDDASGNGHPMTNHGATPEEDGYRFVRAEQDYMLSGDILFASAQGLITLEGWVRDWQTGPDNTAYLLSLSRLTLPYNALEVTARLAGAGSYIQVSLCVDGNWVAGATWAGVAVQSLLTGSPPWHLAVVLEAPSRLSLYVGGIKRAEKTADIPALAAGTYRLRLGHDGGAAPTCVLDEVRLSKVVRYASAFTPQRLVASGMYTSPTLDCLRTRARWLDVLRTATVPDGCSIIWEVRAADRLDAGGEPVGIWGMYVGDPSVLPVGRYFQWRATLSTASDRLATPLIQSVETQASDRGYNIYHATGPGPDSLDYAEPCARVGPDVVLVDVLPLEAGAVHWFGIRPVDARERETPTVQQEARLDLDVTGEWVMPRPAGALAASAQPAPHAAARLRWRYRVGKDGVVPQTFRIFGDGGTGQINYTTPLGEVPYGEGQIWYAWSSSPLAPGVEHQLAVRAVTADGIWDEQPAVARATPDATPPAVVDALKAETVL
jgi:hypothetical protein